MNLASVTLDAMANDMANNTRNASTQLGQVSDAGAGLVLERIRDQLGAIDVVLWNSAGVAVASAGESMLELSPERPSAQVLRSLRGSQRPLTSIEGLDDDLGVSGTVDLLRRACARVGRCAQCPAGAAHRQPLFAAPRLLCPPRW